MAPNDEQTACEAQRCKVHVPKTKGLIKKTAFQKNKLVGHPAALHFDAEVKMRKYSCQGSCFTY
jgi:hypothetical protein